ncbi:MAG: diiron oxygenase [Deltaproteobacteria bacterium]|nr:diiron oxygenase [Deltaproteobacteria bacterium]
MDLGRMLAKCVREQWSIDDLDWSVGPPCLPREKEEAVVQAFLDMSGVELLAGALFDVQRAKTTDPTLHKIFSTFVVDEKRHSAVALRLARHYDVHHYREYVESPTLTAFRPHFLKLVRETSPEIANAYITSGELILDVALLRSLDDYVADDMSHRAMHLINRDESRHIAIDFHMTEHYASDAYLDEIRMRPRPSIREMVRMTRVVATMMWHAKPFLQDVFLKPMDRTDPTGRRVQEAFKRIQLLLRKPTVARSPFSKMMIKLQEAYNHPFIGKVLGRFILRALGADPRAARILFTQEELARAQQMSFEELAEDALAAKLS